MKFTIDTQKQEVEFLEELTGAEIMEAITNYKLQGYKFKFPERVITIGQETQPWVNPFPFTPIDFPIYPSYPNYPMYQNPLEITCMAHN